jgi:hypothetical protein
VTGPRPDPGRAAEERAAYRAFVREHHPDRGGDPEVFIAGLARFRTSGPPGGSGPAWDEPGWDDPRWDAPVEIVHPLPLPTRVVVALIRTVRRQRRHRVDRSRGDTP